MSNQRLRIGVVFDPAAPIYSPEKTTEDPTDVYFGPLLRGFHKAAGDYGVDIVYARQTHSDAYRYAVAEKLDGLVILTFGLDDMNHLADLRSNAIPHIIVGVSAPKGEEDRYPCVDASNVEGGRTAARHLLDLGHRKIACVNLAGHLVHHCDRMYGFIEEMKENGVPVDFDRVLVEEGYIWPLFEEQISDWLRSLLDRHSLPTAVFACDFIMAEAVYNVLRKFELGIPGDVSVIGFDDPPPGKKLTPALTTVRQPIEAIAMRSVARIVDACVDRDHPKPIAGSEVLPTELVVRESTAALVAASS